MSLVLDSSPLRQGVSGQRSTRTPTAQYHRLANPIDLHITFTVASSLPFRWAYWVLLVITRRKHDRHVLRLYLQQLTCRNLSGLGVPHILFLDNNV